MTRREAEELFLDHLSVIERTIKFAARTSRFSPADSEDFGSWVHERLIDDDYAIVRRFEARCGFPTFINVVIQRLAGDYRDHLWGKYRASKRATQLGDSAVELERLIRRDGYSIEEAIRLLRVNHEVPESADELRQIAAQLKLEPKRRMVGDEALENLAASADVEDRALAAEREHTRLEVRRVLAQALAQLPADDLLLLRLYFEEDLSIPAIARRWDVPPRPLYRQRVQALEDLREVFKEGGIAWEQVQSVLGWDPPEGEPRPDERDALEDTDESE